MPSVAQPTERYLRRVRCNLPANRDDFPFNLRVLEGLDLNFESAVTFFVGENGTGKSTLLEAIAVASRCVAIGSADLDLDPSLDAARRLATRLRLVRGRRPTSSMFFRAEDAFGFVKRIGSESQALRAIEDEFRDTFEDGSYAQRLAVGAVAGQRRAYAERYGEDPDAASHGESFLNLLQSRISPGGLYLLDEPETPLSPLRIMALLKLLMDRVAEGCQLLIATHSPILMALPNAQILGFGEDGSVRPIAYDEVEHVSLTRSFLSSPERYLKQLAE